MKLESQTDHGGSAHKPPPSPTTQEEQVIRTVQCDAGLRLVVFARHLPDVEGCGGRVRQKAEHQDDCVGVGKTVRVDLSVRETKRGHVTGNTSGLTQRAVGSNSPGGFRSCLRGHIT